MGDRENFTQEDVYFSIGNLYENMKVCLCLEDKDKEGCIKNILPLYPLFATFPNPRKPQIYMYVEFESTKVEYSFVYPFDIQMVTNKKHPSLFNELERRVRHGILSND